MFLKPSVWSSFWIFKSYKGAWFWNLHCAYLMKQSLRRNRSQSSFGSLNTNNFFCNYFLQPLFFFSYLVINGHLNTTKKTWRNFEKIFLPGVKSVEARHVLVLKKERGFVTQNNAPLLKWATKKSKYFEFHISTTLSIIKINFAL